MSETTVAKISAESSPKPATHGQRYFFLDGLRGLGALWVVLFHFVNVYVSPFPKEIERILPKWIYIILSNGDLAVEVFFVLSGFVIIHSIYNQTITPAYAGNFVLRRTLRLGPPYWAMLIFHFVWPYFVFPSLVPGFFQQCGGWPSFFSNFFFLPDLTGHLRMVDVSWTLFLEVQFYIAFVILIAFMQQISKIPSRIASSAIIAILLAAMCVWSMYRWYFLLHEDGGHYYDFVSRWYVFFTGTLVYWTTKNKFPRWSMWLYLLLILGISLAMHERRGAATAVVGAMMLIASELNRQQSWLNIAPIQYLAKISYSLFLIHVPIGTGAIYAMLKFTDGSTISILTAFVVGVLCSIIAGDLLYRFVELPSLQLVKKLRPAK